MEINFFDRDVIRDPYPLDGEVRARGGVLRTGLLADWMLPVHAAILASRHDTERFSRRVSAPEQATPWFGGVDNMLVVDPPEHTRLRGVMSRAFARKSVEA